MNIWLVKPSEPLPIDNNGNDRLFRAGMLAGYLSSNGHSVTWWTSDFHHQKKQVRFGKYKEIDFKENYKIICLPGPTYEKNISIKRLINHYCLKKEFEKNNKNHSKPDLIIASYPTIELSYAAVKYGKKNNIPVLVDIRDLWPDVFITVIPGYMKIIGKLLLSPYFIMKKYIFKNATGIMGNTQNFVEWGLKSANREKTSLDYAFPMSYNSLSLPKKKKDNREIKFECNFNFNKFTICFFGTLGVNFDFKLVFEALHKVELELGNNQLLQLLICGEGTEEDNLQILAKQYSENIIFTGWLNQEQLSYIMHNSKIGLAPYIVRNDFLNNIPNKPVEYLFAGLPVLSGIDGEIGGLIKKYNCGYVYDCSEKLRKILIDLINNPDQLEQSSVNAKNVFKDNFSSEKIYPELIGHLEYVANKYNNINNKINYAENI